MVRGLTKDSFCLFEYIFLRFRKRQIKRNTIRWYYRAQILAKWRSVSEILYRTSIMHYRLK